MPFSDDSTYNFIRLLDRNNWLHKLLDKRRPDGSLCFLDSLFNESLIDDLARHSTRMFFLSNRLTATYMLSAIERFNKDKVVVLNSFLDTELIQVIYTSKLLEAATRRRLRSKLVTLFEGGQFTQLYWQFELAAAITSQNFYDSIQSVVDDSVKVDNLKLDYFESLIFYLFSVYFVVFALFTFHVILKFLKKPGRRFPRITFSRYKIDFDVKIVLKCPTFR